MRRRTPAFAGAIIALVVLAAPATVAAAEPGGHTTQSIAARADWSAGPVARGTGYARPGGSRRVREVQRHLRDAGYDLGPVDGLYGPRTERAVRRFQRDAGLAPDAVAGRRTLRALRTRGDAAREPRPAPAPIPAAVPAPPPQATAPVAAPERAPLPLAPMVTALAALGLAVAVGSYARTRRRVLRSHPWAPPRRASGTGGPAG
jgi:peptidoglycan hydrolase-like protein with peptidoglycan-binding domain